MRVPGGARAGLERDAGTHHACGFGRVEQSIDAHRARKPIRRALARWHRAASFDFHVDSSQLKFLLCSAAGFTTLIGCPPAYATIWSKISVNCSSYSSYVT